MNILLVNQLEANFASEANEQNAIEMARYMKNHFTFIGLKAEQRRSIQKIVFKDYKPSRSEIVELLLFLWHKKEREFHYASLDLAKRFVKKLSVDDIPFIEHLIVTYSWWDTVDMLATSIMGPLLLKNPNSLELMMDKWMHDNNMWLQRTAILCQLHYKTKTNQSLLEQAILANIDSNDFFIKKAIGWSLRSYAVTNPTWVVQFVQKYDTDLSGLSKREALKYL